MATVATKQILSFKAPPNNIDLYIGGRQVFYRSNMEHVTGILPIINGGTGNNTFNEDKVIIYSKGKLVSTNITKEELETLSGISIKTEEGTPISMIDLLGGKVSTITTYDGTPLDMDECEVKLPDFLLKKGGTINGNLTVEGDFKVGSLKMAWDDVTKCISFSIV